MPASCWREPAPPPALAPLKRKLEAAETVLARETGLAAELDAQLDDPRLYVGDPGRLTELKTRRARLAERVAKAEAEWMALAEQYEGGKAG